MKLDELFNNMYITESRYKSSHITQQESPVITLDEVNKIISDIKNDCSEFLILSKDKNLYRGTERHKTLFYKSKSLSVERLPSHSSPWLQKKYDNYLISKNIEALRSNSIFTSGDKNQASQYGKVYIIFPINGFKFSWSKEKKDIILTQRHFFDFKLFQSDLKNIIIPWITLNKLKINTDEQNSIMSLIYYIKNESEETLNFTLVKDLIAEIDLLVRRLDFAQVKTANNNKIMAVLDSQRYVINDKIIEKNFRPTDKDLYQAMSKGHEILIKGEYYAVDFMLSEILDMKLR